MKHTIELARDALILFIQSLPANSKFNVCSYGSTFDFMFKRRSVDYDDETIKFAIEEIQDFKADYGGTKIFEPLAEIFSQSMPDDCTNSHIFLMTDGAIWDT